MLFHIPLFHRHITICSCHYIGILQSIKHASNEVCATSLQSEEGMLLIQVINKKLNVLAFLIIDSQSIFQLKMAPYLKKKYNITERHYTNSYKKLMSDV
jgi:hypothetical protein